MMIPICYCYISSTTITCYGYCSWIRISIQPFTCMTIIAQMSWRHCLNYLWHYWKCLYRYLLWQYWIRIRLLIRLLLIRLCLINRLLLIYILSWRITYLLLISRLHRLDLSHYRHSIRLVRLHSMSYTLVILTIHLRVYWIGRWR